MLDQDLKEFSARDDIAKLTYEKLLEQLCKAYKMGTACSPEEYKSTKKWTEEAIANICKISYYAADTMRKARLGAFE